jgi:hypothetical protein
VQAASSEYGCEVARAGLGAAAGGGGRGEAGSVSDFGSQWAAKVF